MVALNEDPSRIDASLKAVDGMIRVWVRESWDWPAGQANAIWRMMRQREGAGVVGTGSSVSPGTVVLDEIMPLIPREYFALIRLWYTYGGSVEQKARRLGTNRTRLYERWRRVLEYVRGQLHARGFEC